MVNPNIHAHRAVSIFFEEQNRQDISLVELGKRAGMTGSTLASWRLRSMPRVDYLEAALNCLGYRLAVVPLEEENETRR